MLLDPETLLNPFPLFRELREKSPVLWSEEMGYWLVFRYEDVKRVLEDANAFSSEDANQLPKDAFLPYGMGNRDAPDHGRLRALAQPAFTPRRVAKLEQRIQEICDSQLDEMAKAGDAFDLVATFSSPLPVKVIAELLGVPSSDSEVFLQFANDVLLFANKEHAERGIRAARQLGEYYASLLRERERTGALGDDLTSDLLRARAAGASISELELIAMGQGFLIAGHETTTNLINNAVRSLSENPQAQEFFLADLGRAPMVLEEVLRYRGPALGLTRRTRHDVVLSGVTLPAGSIVLPLIASANRDPRAFDDPDRFIPDRNPKDVLSFGRGIHKCIGEPLARLEAKIAIPALYRRFPRLRVDPERQTVPIETPIVHGTRKLPVRI